MGGNGIRKNAKHSVWRVRARVIGHDRYKITRMARFVLFQDPTRTVHCQGREEMQDAKKDKQAWHVCACFTDIRAIKRQQGELEKNAKWYRTP